MEEMNELFYREPYTKQFSSVVKKCTKCEKGFAIVLEDTAFYPEGGGQSCDTGFLNGIEVFDVQRENNEVVHYLKSPLEEGKTITGVIDWNRRFDNMQNHTGEHIVSGLIHQAYGYDNVGFHMGKDVIQIDFNGPLSWKQLMEIEDRANEIVMSDRPVRIFFPDGENLKNYDYRSKKELKGKVRLVEIPEADLCACCGTHVSFTGEIGLIKILSVSKNRNGVRLEMLSGKRAIRCVQNVFSANRNIMDKLSCKMYESDTAVDKMIDDHKEIVMKVNALQERLMSFKLTKMEENQPLLIDVEENMERVTMVHMGNAMLNDRGAGVAVVLSKEEDGYAYFICSHSVSLSSLAKELNMQLHGRGGGREDNIQGKFLCDLDSIIYKLKQVFLNER